MTVYSRVFEIPALTEKEFELEIEGDVITHVRIRFPPGPASSRSFPLRKTLTFGETTR